MKIMKISPLKYGSPTLLPVSQLVSTNLIFQLQFERGWQGVKGRQSGSTGPLSKLMTDAVDNDNAILDDMGLSGAVADTDCWDSNGPDPAILRSLIIEMC